MQSEIQPSEANTLKVLPESIDLKEGMKVYFAGYPLGQDTVTFHKGTISSISEDQGVKRFTIDGTVVPGNSGGPVVIQHEGQVYLVGVITSEVADFSPEDQTTLAIMNALSKTKREQPQPSGFRGLIVNQYGVTTSISITTSQGVEVVSVNDRDITSLALDLIQRNLSTGIGKAIDIRHYKRLFQAEFKLQETDRYSFPVRRGKALISGFLVQEEDQNCKVAQYVEVRYGKTGRGNRGVRIILQPNLGTGFCIYKFSPNPHNTAGNYNKNQKDLYDQAACKMVNLLISEKQVPQSFDFDACQERYSAKLEINTTSLNL